MVKRSLDILLSLIATAILIIPCLIIALLIKATSPGPILYVSKRVGQHGKLFNMPKFRTMRADTPELATDKLGDPVTYLTPVGGFLRKTSLDELPQIMSVLLGHMSLVGPRPALFNQSDLIAQRQKRGIDNLRPGITGWAQINGRDDISLNAKVQLDAEYMTRQSLWFDIRIMLITIYAVVGRKDISH
jgi:O-antigen biosynthesis protein WbqP